MTQTPRIEPFDGSLLVRTPYNAGFVDELKAMIPWGERSWASASKYWVVDEKHEDIVTHLIQRYYGAFEIIDPDTGDVTLVEADGSRHRQERIL